MRILAGLILVSGLVRGAEFSEEDVKYFRDEVRPLLEQHCVRCHGGTDGQGQPKVRGGLQLISRKGILLGGDHGSAFDVEKPMESLLLHVLSYEDEDLQMPPKGRLGEAERAVFAEWVKRGLPWTPGDADVLVEVDEEHGDITTVNETTKAFWSYKPMVRPEVPAVGDPAWSGPVDAFIWEGVRKLGLTPNPVADRRELIRRVYFDVTGLPPSLEAVRAFEEDRSPDAWEKVVDRLLADSGYGEKWGRHWLDVVRYAETNGFERDGDKPAVWRYRDYVINAFNADKPYDEFLREQLAGDELQNPTLETLTATGYHRLMQWDDEPADKKQHMFDVLDDDLRTTAEGMLAMTLGCARCHDHKGDPMSQEDYYSFMAFFRGMTPMSRGKGPVELVQTEESDAAHQEALVAHEKRRRDMEAKVAAAEEELRAALIQQHPDLAVRLGAEDAGYRTVINDARSGKPGTWHFTTERPEGGWSAVGFRADEAGWKKGAAGFGVTERNRMVRTPWDTAQIWLQTTFLLEEIPKSVKLRWLYDEDLEVFLNGQPVLERKGFVVDYAEERAGPKFLEALQTGRNVISVHLRNMAGGQYFDMGLFTSSKKAIGMDEALKKHGKKGVEALVKKRENLRRALTNHDRSKPKPGVEVLAIRETGTKVPPMFVHVRGNANAEDEDRQVEPRVPEILGGEVLEATPPENGRPSSGRRMALAEWIVRDDNPRTARVMMNRVWQHYFGRGICPTPNDFGYLGERPTHPELLDWLAAEFVARDWSLKAMHKEILMSRAYRMSSRSTEEGLAKDPDNKSFWRFNMRRLGAEEVRDSILEVAGTLNRKMGGPSVYIPLPPEVLATASRGKAAWGQSKPEDEVRRTVYTKVKRSLVPPQLAELDLADTDASCPVRFTTIVPTQALGFLNSEFMNDQAKVLAERLRTEGGATAEERMRFGLELALSRPATERELEYGGELMRAMREEHGLDATAAMDRFALFLLNLNEFIFLD